MRNRTLNIYKRKDGRYEGRAYLTVGNQRRYKSVYGKTEKEAAEKLVAFLNESEHGETKIRSRRYFNDLLDEWILSLNIKESSLCCYKTKIENHIRPYFTDYLADYLKQFVCDDECYVLSGTSKVVEPRAMTYNFKKT